MLPVKHSERFFFRSALRSRNAPNLGILALLARRPCQRELNLVLYDLPRHPRRRDACLDVRERVPRPMTHDVRWWVTLHRSLNAVDAVMFSQRFERIAVKCFFRFRQ